MSYDTDVSHYSISELLDLVGLSGVDGVGEDEFSDIIAGFVLKYRDADETLSRFFEDVGQRLYGWLAAEEWEVKGDDDKREGLAMREGLTSSGGAAGAKGAGAGEDDYLDGEGGNEDGEGVDANDIMGLRRDLKRGLVSGAQQLKWEKNQYLDDSGGEEEGGGGGGGGGGSKEGGTGGRGRCGSGGGRDRGQRADGLHGAGRRGAAAAAGGCAASAAGAGHVHLWQGNVGRQRLARARCGSGRRLQRLPRGQRAAVHGRAPSAAHSGQHCKVH